MSTEIPLKAWVIDEAHRLGLKPSAIYGRLQRGKYAWLPLFRVNARRVFVRSEAPSPRMEAAIAAE